jgi:hypothetical protein
VREKSNEPNGSGEGGRAWGRGGAPGARGLDRAGLGWVGLGWTGSQCGSKPTTRTTIKRTPIASRKPKQNKTNIRHQKRNVRQHDATPMTLRFWFIHDTDTCHYTGLKLGRRCETGREKRVTPEFGERKEEKIPHPNSGRYKPIPLKRISPSRLKFG